jgi:hypothetical protein
MKTVEQLTETLTWTFDNGTLTISGTGEMPDYNDPSDIPWYDDSESITAVIIQNGVTTIGDSAFESCSSLTSITIGNSVTTIGEWAFYGCSNLRNVTVLRTSPPSITYSYSGNTSIMSP